MVPQKKPDLGSWRAACCCVGNGIGQCGVHFGDDCESDRFGGCGADIESHGTVQTPIEAIAIGAQFGGYATAPGARPEKPHVWRSAGLAERAQVGDIRHQVMTHDDGGMTAVDVDGVQ